MIGKRSVMALLAAVALILAGCGGDEEGEDGEGGGEGTVTDTVDGEGAVRTIEAPSAAITVDGDVGDWSDIAPLDLTLESISAEDVEPRAASVRVAHDGEFVYVLFEVEDDYNWDPAEPHLSGSSAVMWAVEEGSAPHMGAETPDLDTSHGVVDIWHWELDCAAGVETGGEVSDPGDGDPGNDGACNLDDEWATTPEEREDDLGEGAENSLLGVWNHTNPTDDAAGTWIFELRRPLQTGDAQDGQFAVGDVARLALAYWDPDNSPEGWDDPQHAQSANEGWIEVTLA